MRAYVQMSVSESSWGIRIAVHGAVSLPFFDSLPSKVKEAAGKLGIDKATASAGLRIVGVLLPRAT